MDISAVFPPSGYADWYKQALKDLKADSLPDTMFAQLEEGIRVQPLYDSSGEGASLPPIVRTGQFSPRQWHNMALVVCQNSQQANAEALKALQLGAEGLVFDMSGAQQIDMDILGQEIEFDYIKTVFVQPLSTENLPKGFVVQPSMRMAERESLAEVVAEALLGIYRQLTLRPSDSEVFCWLEVGDRFFAHIASLRALRILAQGLAAELGREGFELQLMAQTTIRDKTPEQILISNPLQALAAILGGVDMLLIQPHEQSDFGRRIALNVSHILREEAYLDKFADPVAGSYFLSALTAAFCEKSWELFKQKI